MIPTNNMSRDLSLNKPLNICLFLLISAYDAYLQVVSFSNYLILSQRKGPFSSEIERASLAHGFE